MAALSVRELVKVYRGRKVVDRVSLGVESGQVIGLLGPNGAGKTTTFYMTVGLIKPDGGQVFLDDDGHHAIPHACPGTKGVGYLPQEASIFRKLTVRQNILAILETLPMSRQQRHERTDRLLDELGITHVAESKAAVLSGGERRRLEITPGLGYRPGLHAAGRTLCRHRPAGGDRH
jgi:lipopolysaccharide export system ATP-binding protein